MTRPVLALLVLALVACTPTVVTPVRVKAPPVPVTCAAACISSCLPETWPQWTGDPNAPATWDAIYPDVASPLKEIAKQCDAARQACVQCFGRVERAEVLCGITVPCHGGEP